MQQKSNFIFGIEIVGLVAAAIIVAILLHKYSIRATTNPISATQKREAPDFILLNLEGKQVRLSDFHGKPVMINFWATWCGPCVTEMSLLEEISQKYPDDLVILALNDDEATKDVTAFRDKMGITFPILLDAGGKVSDLYETKGLPTSIFIDREGNIQSERIGTLSKELLNSYLNTIGVQP